MNPSLKMRTALSAGYLAGENISCPVFAFLLDNTLFLASLLHDQLRFFKILMADNSLMMVFKKVLVLFAVICMAVGVAIGIGLLINHIASIFLIL